MAAARTTYLVELQYGVTGSTSVNKTNRALNNMGRQLRQNRKYTNHLVRSLQRLALFFGGGLLIKEAFKSLVMFNVEMEDMKNSMAGVIKLNFDVPFSEARKHSEQLVLDMREMARLSPGTTKNFADVASIIAPALFKAGGGLEDLKKLTQGSIVGGAAFRLEQDVAARDIMQVLTGNMKAVDKLPKMLGLDSETINAMKPSERLKVLLDKFSDKAFKSLQLAYESSFLGASSTFKDNLQIALGEAGEPLFFALRDAFISANQWITNNRDSIEEGVRVLGTFAVRTFKFLGTVIKNLWDNRDVFIKFGKVLLAVKAVGMMVTPSAVMAFGSSLRALVAGKKGSSIGNVVTGFGNLVSSTMALIGAFEIFMSWLEEQQEADIEAQQRRATVLTPKLGFQMDEGGFSYGKYGDLRNAANDLFKHGVFGKEAQKWVDAATGNAVYKFQEDYGKLGKMGAFGVNKEVAQYLASIVKEDLKTGTIRDPKELANLAFDYFNKAEAPQHGPVGTQLEGFKSTVLSALGQANPTVAMRDSIDISQKDLEQLAKFVQVMQVVQIDPAAQSSLYSLFKPKQDLGQAKNSESADTKVDVNINKIVVPARDPDRFVIGLTRAVEKMATSKTSSQRQRSIRRMGD